MVKQLKKVIKIYNYLYLKPQGIFAFDQSSNHTAYSPNALRVSRINLNPSLLKDSQAQMQNGWYMENNKRIDQELYKKESYDEVDVNGEVLVAEQWIAKGVRLTLKERELCQWNEFSKMGKTWKFKYDNKHIVNDINCFPYCLLSLPPDFLEQKSSLQEIVEESDDNFTLYPKYNCKLNWIERYWENTRYIARREYDYSYKSLKENVTSYLDHASPPQ